MVFSDPQRSELDATISETAIPAPNFLQRLRKGRSVTPAMGATMRLFRSWTGPIFNGGRLIWSRAECAGGNAYFICSAIPDQEVFVAGVVRKRHHPRVARSTRDETPFSQETCQRGLR